MSVSIKRKELIDSFLEFYQEKGFAKFEDFYEVASLDFREKGFSSKYRYMIKDVEEFPTLQYEFCRNIGHLVPYNFEDIIVAFIQETSPELADDDEFLRLTYLCLVEANLDLESKEKKEMLKTLKENK